MKLRNLSWAIATLSVMVFAGQQPTWAGDPEFITSLAEGVKALSPDAQRWVQQLGNTNNIKMAKGMCKVMNQPQVTTLEDLLTDVFDQKFFDIALLNQASSQEDQATGVGEYLGIVLVQGTLEYCPEHQPKVRGMFGL